MTIDAARGEWIAWQLSRLAMFHEAMGEHEVVGRLRALDLAEQPDDLPETRRVLAEVREAVRADAESCFLDHATERFGAMVGAFGRNGALPWQRFVAILHEAGVAPRHHDAARGSGAPRRASGSTASAAPDAP